MKDDAKQERDSPRSQQAVWDALKSIVELKFGREKNDDRH